MTKTLNDKIKQLTFYILLLFLFVFIIMQMTIFIPAILGAVAFYVILRKWMHKLVEQKKWKKPAAAALLLFVSFLIVLVPVGLLAEMLYSKIGDVVKNSEVFMASLNKFSAGLESKFHIKMFSGENIQKAGGMVAAYMPKLLGATFNTFTSILIMYFILYFMLVKSREMEAWLYEYIPFKDANVDLLGKEMRTLVVSNAVGVPVTAILQGAVAFIGYLILGVPDAWFWFALTAVAAMFPFVGSAAGYVPAAIILYAQGDNVKGTIMLLFGVIVVGLVDNVFRLLLQKKMGDVHPLITVFGVIVGLKLFGFIGLIFGPILISLFIMLAKIYMNEFVEKRTPAKDALTIDSTEENESKSEKLLA